jgi:DegV family protein with EDD domain
MHIRIVADTTCDIPEDLAKKHQITTIPTCINIGDRTYLDGIDMTREQFYEDMPNFPSLARTSAPGPEIYIKTYERLALEGADEIISIHPPATLSNLFNVAQLAAGVVTRVNVTPLDLGQVSLGTGLLALMAARAAKAGKGVDAIIRLLLERAAHTYIFAALETMEYLKRSGRISGLVADIGSLLKIKPVVMLSSGVISISKVRTSRYAMDYLIRQVRKLGPIDQVAFMHTRALQRAHELVHSLDGIVQEIQKPLMVEATPILGTHVGLGAVGMVVITK